MNPQPSQRRDLRPLSIAPEPQNIEAEQAVLGSMLIDNSCIERVAAMLRPEHFSRLLNRTVFLAALDCVENGEAVDYLTVLFAVARVRKSNIERPERDRIQIADNVELDYLAELTERVPTSMNVMQYAVKVLDCAQRRALMAAARTITDKAEGSPVAEWAIDHARDAIEQIEKSRGVTADPVQHIQAVFAEMAADWDRRKDGGMCGMPTGFDEIDAATTGLEGGMLYVIAARPSNGKTSLAANIATSVSGGGNQPTLFFTSEISNLALCELMAGLVSKVNSRRAKRGLISDFEYDAFTAGAKRIIDMPLWCDATPSISIQHICRRSKRLKEKNGLKVIFVDYLQRLSYENADRGWNDVKLYGEMCKRLKTLARELDIAVVLLAQLNRASTGGGNRPRYPLKSDIRGSGEIEQEADAIFLLHYGFHEKFPADAPANEVDVFLAKQRNGAIGQFKLRFTGEYRRFDNMPLKEARPPEANYQDTEPPSMMP